MKQLIYLFFGGLMIVLQAQSQSCPYIDFRNNGNGQANNCPNVNGTPYASNFSGTPYATGFTGLSKTGNIRFVFDGIVTAPPAIKSIWIGSTLSNVVAGPASVPELVNGNTRVSYCFYGQNLPTAGFYTIEFVNPQTNELFSLCGFSGSSNTAANPPVIITQPQTQSVCEGNTLTLSVVAQAAYGGTLNYQWKKEGVNIAGATSSIYTKSGVLNTDAGNYTCLISENNGTFILSQSAVINVINCSSNTYMDACGMGAFTNTNTNSWSSAWVDYDNDNWEDLYICDKSENAPNSLYHNSGNSNFQLVSGLISSVTSKSVNSTWADYDRDGLKDVYITNATAHRVFCIKIWAAAIFKESPMQV
ncbi:MAG: VCBS repeat-containing protein [Sphingobacteriales bacterium]|nr:VCBS repeat-containing protein [Sphingobacteriales bacterium]